MSADRTDTEPTAAAAAALHRARLLYLAENARQAHLELARRLDTLARGAGPRSALVQKLANQAREAAALDAANIARLRGPAL